MQRVGYVLHVSSSRNIVAKAENTPRIGDMVIDENLKAVGRVFDIIGPVSAPYVTIKPVIQNAEKLKNKSVYVIPSKRRKEKK